MIFKFSFNLSFLLDNLLIFVRKSSNFNLVFRFVKQELIYFLLELFLVSLFCLKFLRQAFKTFLEILEFYVLLLRLFNKFFAFLVLIWFKLMTSISPSFALFSCFSNSPCLLDAFLVKFLVLFLILITNYFPLTLIHLLLLDLFDLFLYLRKFRLYFNFSLNFLLQLLFNTLVLIVESLISLNQLFYLFFYLCMISGTASLFSGWVLSFLVSWWRSHHVVLSLSWPFSVNRRSRYGFSISHLLLKKQEIRSLVHAILLMPDSIISVFRKHIISRFRTLHEEICVLVVLSETE